MKRPLFTFSRLQVGCAIVFAAMNTAANAIFLHYTTPVWVLFFSAWLLKEKPIKIDWATLTTIIVGIILMFGEQDIRIIPDIAIHSRQGRWAA